MKTSRRALLLASLGAAQLALLGRFGAREAIAGPTPTGPTKLLCIRLDGGCNWEHIFTPLTASGIDKFIRPPEGGNHPFGYSKGQVRNFDGSAADLADPGTTRKLRGRCSGTTRTRPTPRERTRSPAARRPTGPGATRGSIPSTSSTSGPVSSSAPIRERPRTPAASSPACVESPDPRSARPRSRPWSPTTWPSSSRIARCPTPASEAPSRRP